MTAFAEPTNRVGTTDRDPVPFSGLAQDCQQLVESGQDGVAWVGGWHTDTLPKSQQRDLANTAEEELSAIELQPDGPMRQLSDYRGSTILSRHPLSAVGLAALSREPRTGRPDPNFHHPLRTSATLRLAKPS
jgi:hypothetical protein